MSLRIWLPLNGSLKNQGLDKITVTNNGATVDNNGKIGKCYYFDGSDDYINLGSSVGKYFDGSPFSITFWIRSEEDGTRGIIFSAYGLSSTSNFFALEINGSSGTMDNYLRFDWLGADIKFFQGAITPNVWLHFAITYNGSKVTCYRNGEFYGDVTRTLSSIPTGNSYYLGRDSRTGATAFKGRLNDFRLYDHCLSLQEIKKISQGLILHYPLNRNGFGQENLLPCGGSYTYNSPWTVTTNRTDGHSWVTNSAFEATPSTTYTISVQCDGTLTSYHGRGNIPITDKPFAFWLYICNADTTKSWSTGQYDSPVILTSENHNYRKIGNTHVWTYTLSSNQKYISLRTNSYSDGSNNITINWWNMKIEKGDKFTPWCPNSSDSLATLVGMNTNVVKDISGYQNNGELIGTFSYTTDTPKYNVSTYAQGGASTYLKGVVLPSEAKTVSLWIKAPKNVSSTIFNDKTTGLQIGLLNSLLYANSLASTTPFTTTHWTNDGWNHVVVINNNGTRSCYINGEAETQSGSNNYYIHNANEFWVWNRSYNNNYPFTGSLSDLRIYSTALSADEVKELYENNIVN